MIKKEKNETNKIDVARKISILNAESTSTAIANTEENSDKTSPKSKEHTRIIFDLNEKMIKKKSILERLGKRQADFDDDDIAFRTGEKKSKTSEIKKEEENINNSKRKTNSDKTGKIDKRKYDWNKNEKRDKIELEKRQVSLNLL